MLTALHPLILWGLAGIAVPILIHLLLRSRPKPRPWGAMRWLVLAAQAASRTWKLTNLLLLLLRCLAVLIAALAIARIAIPGLGGGSHLVVVIDTTASMGERRDDPGSLAKAQAALAPWLAQAPWTAISVISVNPRMSLIADRVSAEAAVKALNGLSASALPGGLDDAVGAPEIGNISGADVLLVGDLQQDRGERLVAALTGTARTVARMHCASPTRNAWVGGVARLGDITPERGGELTIHVGGAAGAASLAMDGDTFVDVPTRAEGGLLTVPIPGKEAGEHVVRIRLNDGGIRSDDLVELPVMIRGPVEVLGVRDRSDWLVAALGAEPQALAIVPLRPSELAARPLPEGGIVALRTAVADGPRLSTWMHNGGVVWTTRSVAQNDPALRPFLPASATASVSGGPWRCDDADLNASLGSASLPELMALERGEGQVLLRAGTAAAVVAYPVGRGRLVVEALDLGTDSGFASRGAAPQWAVRIARRLTAQTAQALELVAGAAAPPSATGAIIRDGRTVNVRPGQQVIAAPGRWRWERDGMAPAWAVVLPSPTEGQIDRVPPAEISADPTVALPARSGADLSLWLLIALMVVMVIEGAVAAWAGKRYAG